MSTIGYARVSSAGQSYDDQVKALKAAGCTIVYKEKISAAGRDRPQLVKLMRKLDVDDVLVVTRLDRLARSTRDLLNLLAEISDKGAAFKSLDNSAIDTTGPMGKLLVTILGALAEFERSLIAGRTAVGLKRAREAGVKFGRPHVLTLHQRNEARRRRDAGEPQSILAASYRVSQPTISRL